ncbi:MAG TPA: glycosyltransferase family 2 protein [Vicinamibacteria bacterium]|nr:glycosyltransferase family 2 protein [Vicinamibacteria bacterium]
MRTIITMPAYNAARTLEKTYLAIPRNCYDEVLVVDDCSPDDTVQVAESLGLRVKRHADNRGYGANQKTCYDWALEEGADIVVLLHPDYQYSPHRVPALVEPILAGRADFSFGSRFAENGRPMAGGMPFHRYVGNRVTTHVENFFLGTSFTELHSGMKAYSRRFLQIIGYHRFSDRFVFDSQMVIQAVLLGFQIKEVAIPTRYAEDSSSVDVWSSLRYILETFGALRHGLRNRERLAEELEMLRSRDA